MKKSTFRPSGLCILFFLVGTMVLHGQEAQEYLHLDSPVYPLLHAILAESGRVLPSTSLPMTKAQIGQILDGFDSSGLSEPGQSATAFIRKELQPETTVEEYSLALEPVLGLEWYGQSLPDYQPVHGFNDRLALLSLELALAAQDVVFMFADYELKEEALASTGDSGMWRGLNLPGSFSYFDIQSPFRAYASIGGDFWNLGLGRDRLEIGPGRFSQLILGSAPHYYDHVQARIFWDQVSYSLHLLSLDATLYSTPADDPVDPRFKPTGDSSRFYVNHRLELNTLEGALRIGLDEGLLVSGQPFDPKYLNPFMILHSFTSWESFSNASGGTASSFMGLDFTLSPAKGISVNGQVVFNQFTLPIEASAGDAGTPGAFGYQLGANGAWPMGSGYLEGGAEWTLTDPWLYLRENPLKSFIWTRNALSNIAIEKQGKTRLLLAEPMGYQYGPDSTGLALWANWRDASAQLGFFGRFERVLIGENGFDGAWSSTAPDQTGAAAVAMRTPTGIPEIKTILSLAGTWEAQTWLGLSGGLDIQWVDQAAHQKNNAILSVEANLGFECRILLLLSSL